MLRKIAIKTHKFINIKQPMKLERLAIKKFVGWITSQAETLTDLHARNPAAADELLSKQIECTQNYIERYLPGAYYDELFKEVLNLIINLYSRTRWADRNGRWDALGRMIETVLSEKLTVLSMHDGWEIFEAAFESKCEKLTGLQYLDLPYDAREHVAIKLLEKANGLRRLTMSATHATNILRRIVQNCTLVEYLFFSSCHVTDDDINILTELCNLKYVELYRENGVSEMAVEKLLMSCENLERLIIYPFKDIREIIERVSRIKAISGKQLKLNYLDHFCGRTQEQLQIYVRNCPFIQELNLNKNKKYIEGDQVYLESVKELQHLRKLGLGNFDFYTDRVNEVLKAIGRGLTGLCFWNVTEMDLHSLNHISVMCPILQNYELSSCRFAKETSMDKLNNKMEISPLRYVEIFTLRVWDDAPPTLEQLQFLLTNHPRVECLKAEGNLLQEAIMAVLNEHPKSFMYLRNFETHERLSMLVIDRVVQNSIYPIVVKAQLLT